MTSSDGLDKSLPQLGDKTIDNHRPRNKLRRQRAEPMEDKSVNNRRKSVKLLKKSLDVAEEEEEEEEGEEGDDEGEEEEDEGEEGEEGEEDEGEEEEGDESDGADDSPDNEPDDRQDEANQGITTTTTTTTTTTPAAPERISSTTSETSTGSAEDFIDRSQSSSIDKDGQLDRLEEPSSGPSSSSDSSVSVDREENDENVKTNPDERVNVDQRPNQMDKPTAASPATDHDANQNRTGSVGDIRSHSNVDDQTGPAEGKENDKSPVVEEDRSSEDDTIQPLPAGPTLSETSSTGWENVPTTEGKTRMDPSSQSNLIAEENSLVEKGSVEVEEEEEDREEANEIRAQVQSEKHVPSSGSVSVSSEDETNDIEVHPSGIGAKASEAVGSVGPDQVETNDPQAGESIHPSRTNQNKVVNEPLPPTVTDMSVGSGDEEDETNDIRTDPITKSKPMDGDIVPDPLDPFRSGEPDDTVANEIETLIHPTDGGRFLHGQNNHLNPALLDTSCGPSTRLPVIANALVTKYGRCVCLI